MMLRRERGEGSGGGEGNSSKYLRTGFLLSLFDVPLQRCGPTILTRLQSASAEFCSQVGETIPAANLFPAMAQESLREPKTKTE